METETYLTFTLGYNRYGINTEYLEEMFQLPEVTLLPAASKDIIGTLNVRGEIIPVIDPKLSLGQKPTPYQTSDYLILLRQSQLRVGLIVNAIGTIETLPKMAPDSPSLQVAVPPEPARRKNMLLGQFNLSVTDISTAGEITSLWLLGEPRSWLRYVEIQQLISVASILEEQGGVAAETGLENRIFCPEAPPETQSIFRQRATSLKTVTSVPAAEDLLTLAIIEIAGTAWGVDLTAVKEFTEVDTLSPIPCCPPHIIGNLNLRGDILTLVDIRHCLADPTEATVFPMPPGQLGGGNIMVIEIEPGEPVGILVQAVTEAVFPLRQSEQIQTDWRLPGMDPRFLRGGFRYRNSTLGLLDLNAILTEGALLVEEMV